jgi:FMN-dependent NADH-azoreductase
MEIDMTAQTVLRIDASARTEGSVTRELADRLAPALAGADGRVIVRDLGANPPSLISQAWVGANFTPEAERSEAQNAELAESDALVAELKAADVLVIGVPVYNFGVPAALKAWVDLVARARVTFRYTEAGPEGLLKGKKAYLLLASGGTQAGSEIDFASGYMRHILGFLGITDVELIAADRLMMQSQSKETALARIDAVAGGGAQAA